MILSSQRTDSDRGEILKLNVRAGEFAAAGTTSERLLLLGCLVPKRSPKGGSAERVDARVLQVIYRFRPDGLSIHAGQQMDVFIEAPPISKITRKKLELSVPNPLARSSYNRTE